MKRFTSILQDIKYNLRFIEDKFQDFKTFVEVNKEPNLRRRSNYDKYKDLFFGYYLRTSISKDYLKNVSNLKKDEIKFLKIYDEYFNDSNSIKEELDIYSYNVTKNFIVNNKIALEIKQLKNYDYKFIESKIKEIEVLQKETQIYSYHPYYKLAQYFDVNYYSILQLNEKSIDLIENIKHQFKSVIKSFKTNLNWCHSRNYNPRQLISKECTFTINRSNLVDPENKINSSYIIDNNYLFFFTSFFKPENYDKLFSDLEEFETNFRNISSQIITLNKIYEHEISIQKTKEEIKSADKNAIQILAIFSAIVVFASGSVNLFGNVKDFYFATLFMLSFGFSLSSFIALIFMFFNNSHITLIQKIISFSLFGILILLIIYLIYHSLILEHLQLKCILCK